MGYDDRKCVMSLEACLVDLVPGSFLHSPGPTSYLLLSLSLDPAP